MNPSLFFDEGKVWGRSRRIISPPLNGHHNVANMIPAIAKVSRKSTDVLVNGETSFAPQEVAHAYNSIRRPCVGPEPLPEFDPTDPHLLADLLAKHPPVRISAHSCNTVRPPR